MNKLQQKLLEMLKWLSDFLEKHSLRYYIIAGTFLGAVRHDGFIPWDDDVDIAMPRKDYEKFIALLKDPVEHYIVETIDNNAKDFKYSFAKFYDMNTSMTEKARVNVKRGVYIDVFPLDGIGSTYEESLKNYKKIDRKNILRAVKTCGYRKGRKWYKNVAAFFGVFLPVSATKLAKKLNALCKEHDFDDCAYVGHLMSTYRAKEIMPKDYYGTPTKYIFEGITVYGPEKADEYLTHLYRDWRQLPPEDKRCSAHDFIDLDLNKPYMKVKGEKMKALILNSGMGTRMGVYTKEHPKCMTDVSATDSILSRQLKALNNLGIKDVVITTGYFDQVLVDYCNSLNLPLNYTFVKNPVYDKTNYIYSIYCAKEVLKDQTIIMMHGDLVFDEKVLKQVVDSERSCMTVSSTLPLPEKDFKAVINGEKIEKVGIEFFDSAVAAQPLYKLNAKDWNVWLDKIVEFCESDTVKCYAENAFNEVSNKCNIYTLDVKDDLCGEIDTPEDLAVMTERIKNL